MRVPCCEGVSHSQCAMQNACICQLCIAVRTACRDLILTFESAALRLPDERHDSRSAGGLPETWANMSGLAYLNVSSNRLAGGIPPELSALRNLTALDMSHNQFSGLLSGPALSSLSAGWSQLEILSISENRFSGPLPSEMSRFRSLHTLHMHANQLDGSIPGEWARGPLSAALSILDVSDNLLTGTLPDEWAQGMTRLAQVNARVNYLQGACCDATCAAVPSLQASECPSMQTMVTTERCAFNSEMQGRCQILGRACQACSPLTSPGMLSMVSAVACNMLCSCYNKSSFIRLFVPGVFHPIQ